MAQVSDIAGLLLFALAISVIPFVAMDGWSTLIHGLVMTS
jgi:type III secretory pathway component EscR